MILERAKTTSAVDRDWAVIAESLAASREPSDVWLRTLAKNLASLETHRPEIFAALASLESIADLPPSAASAEARVADAFAEIESTRRAGHAIALAGIGDGVILRALAKFPPALTLGRQQEVNLIEPDTARLFAALGEHDFTGPRGPIEQKRFAWYVGEAWEASLTRDLFEQPTKMLPQQTIAGGEPCDEVERGIYRIAEQLCARQAEQGEAIADYYANLKDAELLDVLSRTPSRKPRVLLLTSQFTAVLQFSTYDSADAFRELGWETRVATETQPWHLMSRPAIRAAIADFKPDLIFQIDHLRYELGDEVPANLPFVCWIQDHMVNLTSTRAGESICERDFVLTGGVYRYAGRYNYPRQQCIDMPKVARPPVLPTSWPHDREDLLYVSHWSAPPEQTIVEVCNRITEISGSGAGQLMRACTAEMTKLYADGGAMRSDLEVRGLVQRVLDRTGDKLDADGERFFVDVLFQRLNNAFYRQQALTWAGAIADDFGLKLGIYGHGWEKHPTLGRFARGVVTYGPDLEVLTRQSKMLLQLEPYACFTHQRMLDCVLTGGFALIRDHILNTLPIRIRNFLDAHVPAEVNDVPTARECMDAKTNAAFDALLAESRIITDLGDAVEVIRGWQRAGMLATGDEAMPHLNSINFDTFDTLRDRVRTFIADPAARARISADQRASVMGRLTYKAAIGNANRTIYERLRATIERAPTSLATAAEAA